jgi:hypothetical protein
VGNAQDISENAQVLTLTHSGDSLKMSDHPFQGSPANDQVVLKRINERTITETGKAAERSPHHV